MNDSEEERRYCAGPHDWEWVNIWPIDGLQRCSLCGILRIADARWKVQPAPTSGLVVACYPFDLSNTEQP